MNKRKKKLHIPGDKSITHRALLIASVARGKTVIRNASVCRDTLATVNAVRSLGITVKSEKNRLIVYGKGLNGLTGPKDVINCGNSATTMRLLMGLLAGQKFDSVLTGDESLMKRPMDRVIAPLTLMGASIRRDGNRYLVSGRKLHPIEYDMPVSSAQVKSSVMLADLYTEGKSVIYDPGTSRNHTELMLDSFGKIMKGTKISVPGDISSASYIIAKTLLTPSDVRTISNVGINPTRTGILEVLKTMGADITVRNIRRFNNEPTADIIVRYSSLHSTEIKGNIIPGVIDELPLIAVLSSLASGKTVIRDASELRVKESDRIRSIVQGLTALGVNVTETADGMEIIGTFPDKMVPAEIDSFNDHRVAMSFLILADIVQGISVKNKECVAISYPTFLKDLHL